MPSVTVVATTTTFPDLEAQSSLQTPIAAVTHATRTPLSQSSPIPTDAFYTFSLSSTHESRHDTSIADVPPPYVDDLPPYSEKAPEPPTLAKYLFLFGFLFPPFWLIGAWILWSPLQAPSNNSDAEIAWMPEKTEAERKKILETLRVVEVKWALRCLWSVLILILLCIISAVTAWAMLHSQ